MKLRNVFVIIFLVVGVIATYLIVKGYGLEHIIGFYSHFNILLLLLYLFIIFALFTTLTWRWSIILRSRGHRVDFKSLFIYRIIGTAINFFTPGPRVGGEPTQASLLEKHGINFTEGLSSVMIDKIIDTTTCGILFIVGLLLVSIVYVIPRGFVVYIVILSVIIVVLVGLFYYRMLTGRHFFLKIFHLLKLDHIKNKSMLSLEQKIGEIELIMIRFYNRDKKTFVYTLLITLLTWLIMFAEYKTATTLLGLNLGFIELFFIITFIGLAVLFPIPMAVGVLEAGQVSAFNMINVNAGAGVALAFLVRMKDLFWGILGMILLGIYGFDIGKTIEKKYKKDYAMR